MCVYLIFKRGYRFCLCESVFDNIILIRMNNELKFKCYVGCNDLLFLVLDVFEVI